MAALRPPSEDLDARRPVWDALSSLYLDTDTSLLRPWRVRVLAASPYDIGLLERILVDEVHPACRWNLASVAGEWHGFDPAWLERRILARAASRWPAWLGIHLGRVVLLSPEWRATRGQVRAARATV